MSPSSGEGSQTYTPVQLLRLALSKGPSRVDVCLPLREDENRSSYRNVMFSTHLELLTMDKVHKPTDSVIHHSHNLLDSKKIDVSVSIEKNMKGKRAY
jgi:hypothetical protein